MPFDLRELLREVLGLSLPVHSPDQGIGQGKGPDQGIKGAQDVTRGDSRPLSDLGRRKPLPKPSK